MAVYIEFEPHVIGILVSKHHTQSLPRPDVCFSKRILNSYLLVTDRNSNLPARINNNGSYFHL